MIKWTDAAERIFLKAVERRCKQSSAPVDIDKAREEAVALLEKWQVKYVDSSDIQRALNELGYTDVRIGSRRSKRWTGRFRNGWLLFVTVILPAIALGVEVVTGMCADAFFDPIPSVWHVLLVACVPMLGLYGWLQTRIQDAPVSRNVPLVAGVMIGICLPYTLIFLPVIPMGFMVLLFVWYFGFGFIGLLPLSPLLAFIGSLQLTRRATRAVATGRLARHITAGFLIGFALVVLASTPTICTRLWLSMAGSADPASQERGIRLLRQWTSKESLGKALGNSAWGDNIIFGRSSRNRILSGVNAQAVFYRVTGEPFFEEQWWDRRGGWMGRDRRSGEFDFGQGGDAVGGLLAGLMLGDSRMDGVVDAEAGFAYLEWILVFRNTHQSQREARARIAIPPGSVASRVSLWIDGEERNAAFGGRAKTKQAYTQVVRRQRDPILVTTSGPDRLLLQCFPVPPHGEMKVKLGLTIPLDVIEKSGGRAALRLPVFIERNFHVSSDHVHSLWLTSDTEVVVSKQIADAVTIKLDTEEGKWKAHGNVPNTPAIVSRSFISAARPTETKQAWCRAIGTNTYVVQQLKVAAQESDTTIIFAVDTSRPMKPHMRSISEAIKAVPDGRSFAVIVTTDGKPTVLVPPVSANDAARKSAAGVLRDVDCIGGKPQLPMLIESFDLAAAGQGASVVWIHAPVPVQLGSAEALRQRFERMKTDVTIYDLQVGVGPNRVAEGFDGVHAVKSLPVVEDVLTELTLFVGDSTDRWRWERTRCELTEGTPDGKESSKHLARLWANDEVCRICASDDPVRREEALNIATEYGIVTPISGAVVLETAEQFQAAGLEPVPANSVPTVPEPGMWCLLIVTTLVVVVVCLQRKVLS